MRNVIGRAALTAILAVSWNVTATHCALAAAATAITTVEQPQTDECPMHPAAKQAPSPAKKKDCGDVPCCKNLPAAKPAGTVLPAKRAFAAADLLPICSNDEYAHQAPGRTVAACSDTGPPGENPFIAVLLKRSTPAHAPPVR